MSIDGNPRSLTVFVRLAKAGLAVLDVAATLGDELEDRLRVLLWT